MTACRPSYTTDAYLPPPLPTRPRPTGRCLAPSPRTLASSSSIIDRPGVGSEAARGAVRLGCLLSLVVSLGLFARVAIVTLLYLA